METGCCNITKIMKKNKKKSMILIHFGIRLENVEKVKRCEWFPDALYIYIYIYILMMMMIWVNYTQ